MGRVRLQLKKIENKTYRHITFAKRKSGLVKKAYELSTLCDVEVALIIFSPAGKLILFEGKKRLEEIFMRYIDLPHHQRGRLHDQESVRRIIAEMSLQAEHRHQLSSSYRGRESKMSIDSQLKEIQKEIRVYSAALEEVEKQLQYFLKSPNSIRSAIEAEFLEGILEDTLKLVCFHKHDLEAKNSIQLISEKRPVQHPQTAASNSFIMGSSNYCLENWPQQYDTRSVTRFQCLRNQESQPSAEILLSALPTLGATGYPAGNNNAVSSTTEPEFDGYICQPQYNKFFNENFPQVFNNIQEGRTSGNIEQNKVVDAAVGSQQWKLFTIW